jgi:hypothetical protein
LEQHGAVKAGHFGVCRTGRGSIAAISVVSMLFILCLGTFVWTSRHYDGVVASFVLSGCFLIAAVGGSLAFIVVRRGYNRS